ncbi:MAG: lipid-A-disaccharide synthase [Gemmatimonadota bacterium]
MARALLAFAAGEASGDLLAAPVIAALAGRLQDVRFGGIAGDRMIDAGCEAWHHIRELSVRGYAEVMRELPRLLRLRGALRARLVRERASVFVGVDAPDFNLRLEMQLRAAGIPTVQYVSPSIWAWRGKRIEKIRRSASRVLLVFPFEQKIYDDAGIAATYVGHPLAAQIPIAPDPAAARARLQLAARPCVAVLPGSRRAEVEHVGPAFADAMEIMAAREPGMMFAIPAADAQLRVRIEALLATRPQARERSRVFDGESHACLEAADAVLVASGTATLEAALYKKPMVIAYRMPRLSAWIMRRIGGYLPYVGLPNILAGEFLVPELLQEQATPDALARALLGQLADERLRRMLEERFTQIHESLRRDTPALAADAIISTMKR